MTKPRKTRNQAAAPEIIPAITPEEEALLARIAAEADPDDILPTAEELAEARPFIETEPALAARVFQERPELEAPARAAADAFHRRRGRPPTGKARTQVSLRLDTDVLEKFRATGPGWQTRINEALRAALVPGADKRGA